MSAPKRPVFGAPTSAAVTVTVVKDNYSRIVDRKKELVKDNAVQVTSAELEAVLLENMMLPMRRSLESHCTARNNQGPTLR
jgi:hypothetical protein